MNSILAAAGRYAAAGMACPLVVTIALTGVIDAANAATLTPEQQAVVEKYNISEADQQKLFGTAVANTSGSGTQAKEASRQQQASSETSDGPVAGFLSGTYVWASADAYKSLGERITNINGGTGALTGSFGGVAGFNSGLSFGESTFGVQAGASIGIYDFKGRLRIVPDATALERQVFYTAGFYKRGDMSTENPSIADRLSLGVVYDGFQAERWGVNASDISLGQVRGTLGVALSESTEVGVWGTYGVNTDRAAVTVAGAPSLLTTIRAMNQKNVYVKHNFDFGGEVMAYYGIFDDEDIAKWQFGVVGKVPLSDNWSTFASANYVAPRTPSGPLGSGQEQFNASVGIAYYFGGNAASKSVTGNKELPLLDVASNRSFLITD